MELTTPDEPIDLVHYLRDEAPWEVERFESIARLVHDQQDWSSVRPGPRQPSYSSWLLDTFGQFRSRTGLDGAA
jgi:hypothetical protein